MHIIDFILISIKIVPPEIMNFVGQQRRSRRRCRRLHWVMHTVFYTERIHLKHCVLALCHLHLVSRRSTNSKISSMHCKWHQMHRQIRAQRHLRPLNNVWLRLLPPLAPPPMSMPFNFGSWLCHSTLFMIIQCHVVVYACMFWGSGYCTPCYAHTGACE